MAHGIDRGPAHLVATAVEITFNVCYNEYLTGGISCVRTAVRLYE
jgi:hypothetical protein